MYPLRNDAGLADMKKTSCPRGSHKPLEPYPYMWAVSQLSSLLGMQTFRPYSRLRNQDLLFTKIPRGCTCTLQFEKY